MTENFTREHKLVEDISSKGWFANPAGRQGYEVIILEQVGDGGSRFYCSLQPGETLRFGERVFGNYVALAVDMRHARSFPIEGQFAALERGRKVTLRANVRYRVTDARVVAMETVDPLGELRDKVVATLNRELARYPEEQINPGMVEKVIRSVGPVPHLGLTVEDAEVTEFIPDPRITDHVVKEEDVQHSIAIQGIEHRADLEGKQEQYEAIDLSNINVLMQEYPDVIPHVFATFAERDRRLLEAQIGTVKPAIEAYIRQKQENNEDIDPEEIARIMRQAISPSRPQLKSPVEPGKIIWGDEVVDALPAGKPPVTFGDKDEGDSGEKDDTGKPSRVKFGD